MANCNYKVDIKNIQDKYTFKIFGCKGEKGDPGDVNDVTLNGTSVVNGSGVAVLQNIEQTTNKTTTL